jgi:hypothetical protein
MGKSLSSSQLAKAAGLGIIILEIGCQLDEEARLPAGCLQLLQLLLYNDALLIYDDSVDAQSALLYEPYANEKVSSMPSANDFEHETIIHMDIGFISEAEKPTLLDDDELNKFLSSIKSQGELNV